MGFASIMGDRPFPKQYTRDRPLSPIPQPIAQFFPQPRSHDKIGDRPIKACGR